MTLVIQGILNKTDLIDMTYYYCPLHHHHRLQGHPFFQRVSANTIFGISDLTKGNPTLTPTLTEMFVSSLGAKAVLVVVASTCVHLRRYELKIRSCRSVMTKQNMSFHDSLVT